MSLSIRLCTLRIGIHFLKDPGFRALVGLRDPFDDLCCVEGIWYDRLRKARTVATEPGKVYRKGSSFSILLFYLVLVIVSDPGSASPFVRDELFGTSPTFFLFSLWIKEKGGSAGRGLYHERSKGVNPFQIYNMDSGNAMNVVGLSCRSEWIILSTEVNLCLLGKRIASYKFCLGRTCVSITMKFINEVVNGGVTIILFVVTNLVGLPKKRNFSIFRGLKGAWKHIRWMEMEKRCNSSSFGNGKIFGASARRGWSVSSWLGSDSSIFF